MRFDLFKTEREKAKVTRNGLKVLCTDKPLCLQVWRPKATKPYINYLLRNVTERAEYIRKAIKSYDYHLEYKEEQRKARQPDPAVVKQLKKGDLFYTSWGYDQTNYDYIAVLAVSKSGKTAKCRRTSSLNMGTSGQCNVQEPIFSPFGDTFNLRIGTGYQGEVSLRGSYPFCGDGKMDSKRFDYFSKVSKGEQFNETDSQFGH